MNKKVRQIANKIGLKKLAKKAKLKNILLKKDLFEVENDARKKLMDAIGILRSKLLDLNASSARARLLYRRKQHFFMAL